MCECVGCCVVVLCCTALSCAALCSIVLSSLSHTSCYTTFFKLYLISSRSVNQLDISTSFWLLSDVNVHSFCINCGSLMARLLHGAIKHRRSPRPGNYANPYDCLFNERREWRNTSRLVCQSIWCVCYCFVWFYFLGVVGNHVSLSSVCFASKASDDTLFLWHLGKYHFNNASCTFGGKQFGTNRAIQYGLNKVSLV